jgi:hypothetical protein
MIRNKTKTIDTQAIVELFGGKHQIVADYAKILKIVISVKAVEKWIERKGIATKHILHLETIADNRNIGFNWKNFVRENA